MSRNSELTRYVGKDKLGIEIGPWCHPVVPKADGYNCLILDVFDTQTLRDRARQDAGLSAEAADSIEDVDLVGSSTQIAELVKARNGEQSFDYIVSSHNFEHIPDPIKFLRGAEEVLKPGGILTMAIPDKRGCFDYYRPLSSLAEILAANFDARERPTQEQIFERWSLHARQRLSRDRDAISFPVTTNPQEIEPFHDLRQALQEWQAFVATPDEIYRDTHCWVFTPASCELILTDLLYLGLLDLCLVEILPLGDSEFCVHLKKPLDPAALAAFRTDETYPEQRVELLRRINDELSVQASCVNLHQQFVQDLASQEPISELQVLAEIGRDLPAARRVTVFAPHPDDEIFGCGGALAILQAQGALITPVVISDGTRGGEHFSGDPDVRQRESRCAAQLLGLQEPIFLGLKDRELTCDQSLINLLLEQLSTLDPELVFMPAPTELHPDHQTVALAGSIAVQRFGKGQVLYCEIGVPLANPTMLIDITRVMENKLQAMACFVSQLDRQAYDKQIAGLNTFRAYSLESGVESAEAFVCVAAEDIGKVGGVFDDLRAYRRAAADRSALRNVVAQWDPWIAALHRQAEERDHLLTEKNRQIAELEQVIAQWDPWIAALHRQAEERDHLLTEKNRRIAELEHVIAEWDPWIARLQKELAERDRIVGDLNQMKNELDGVYASRSWAMTAPLRAIGKRLRRD